MKKALFICILILVCFSAFSQTCNCDALLQGSLYSFTKINKTGSFDSDMRTYFLSDGFKKDMQNGQWGGSLSLPIAGNVLSIGANSSNMDWSEWHSKIESQTSMSISSATYQSIFKSVPNSSLYSAFTDCQNICVNNGFGFSKGTNFETNEVVVFAIYYKPMAPGTPTPIVKTFNVSPKGSIISGSLPINKPLTSYTILVTCKRDPKIDLVLTLQTDQGSVASIAPAIKKDSVTYDLEQPVGTIIASYLSFDQFSSVTRNNIKGGNIWTSQKSKWSPCDGRQVPGSAFVTLSSQTNVPDLRGVFLRGLNQFDPTESSTVSSNQMNPDNTKLGIFQNDLLKLHQHGLSASDPGGCTYCYTNGGGGTPRGSTLTSYNGDGGAETRPKNVSIYYYIKINN